MSMNLSEQFRNLWEQGKLVPDVFGFLAEVRPADEEQILSILLVDQQQRWRTNSILSVEEYLERLPSIELNPEIKLQLAVNEFFLCQKSDRWPSVQEFLTRFSDISKELKLKLLDSATVTRGTEAGEYDESMYFTVTEPSINLDIGRYRALRVLGEGAFGRVYLGFDDELRRPVAIKVPNQERLTEKSDADAFLEEARTVASLDHPNIVPVYDVGRTDDGQIYIVSRFIEGPTLLEKLRDNKSGFAETALLLGRIADALHYAHQNRIIHRDVKPGNILIEERTGIPYIADFGLALREREISSDGQIVGTPAYMSPEQARGEGHRLDGRSDVFALGAVLYLMLTGRKAFQGSTVNETLHCVISIEPEAPRQIDETIPPELDRICRKAMAKRVTDRHASGRELASDLLSWDSEVAVELQGQQLVPRGLRSFEASDANAFVDLLPGSRNRDGLPESIQFWKTRLEERDGEKTFAVGLLYGPSGCGKSSLVKAGLMPRLSNQVHIVYLEATPVETESRILKGLRKCRPEIPVDASLVQAMQMLRHQSGSKTVLIIDQFEQWLHSNPQDPETSLVAALRQCDGAALQAIVLVRDDFAMAAARFMDAVDIPILQGHNFSTVDLFPEQHAAKVLASFGQAFGQLPAKIDEFTTEQNEFLTAVVRGLATEGKVVPVQLALCAEMIKARKWEHATLNHVGGTAGIGVSFLEETFGGRSANPKHLQHQHAAREILKALLPHVGSDIKGHMRLQGELQQISGYEHDSRKFNELLRILDGELRLITPTDPEGFRSDSRSNAIYKHYQLTHDYLVTSLRVWLTQKQAETKRGRMELRLEERTLLWTDRQEKKQLPSFIEWQGILRHTLRSSWSAASIAMMAAATRLHLTRMIVAATLVMAILVAGFYIRHTLNLRTRSREIANHLDSLWNARIELVPGILATLEPDRKQWIPDARRVASDSATPKTARLRVLLALTPTEDSDLAELIDHMLICAPDEQAVLRTLLKTQGARIASDVWRRIETSSLDSSQTIRAAALLAEFSADDNRWNSFSDFVVEALVRSDPFSVNLWVDALKESRFYLLPHLKKHCLNQEGPENLRIVSAGLIVQFSKLDKSFPETTDLLELSLAADPAVRRSMVSLATIHRDVLLSLLLQEIGVELNPPGSSETSSHAHRKAAAIELAQQLGNDDSYWVNMNADRDPRIRSLLINDFARVNLNWKQIQNRLHTQPARIRQAIVLGLPLRLYAFSPAEVEEAKAFLLNLYSVDPDAGVHSSIDLTLRILGAEESVLKARKQLAEQRAKVGNWNVLSNGLCMVRIERPGFIVLGPRPDGKNASPDAVPGRHAVIDYSFEISTTEITVQQFQEFNAEVNPAFAVTSSPECAMNNLDVFQMMRFCRWLSERQPDFNAERCVYPPVDALGPGLLLAEDYQTWEGFRLPTEDEWEYAIRAGSETIRFFGDTEEHMNQHGWWVMNSSEHIWPAGLKRPNPFGLFDVYGNVEECCHFVGRPFDSKNIATRGGEYRSTQRFLGSANSEQLATSSVLSTTGFRVVRIRK